MKVILISAIIGFVGILFRDRIRSFCRVQWDKIRGAKEEEEMLSLLVEKYEKLETDFLVKLLQGKISDYEKRAIQVVLQKRQMQMYHS
ncbi:hypothetical protein ABGT15_11450 [Flavobacterium enshiense]|uniref:hypothetical protein n=1 Tax=Flavobacterium enshiense TaxID=1341165 RepID=UPI00345DE798